MAGAQAQVLSAAQISLWTRARLGGIADANAAIWKTKKLVRAWCMRRTVFLVPSSELSIFVRGSSRRSAYNLQWAVDRVSSKPDLDRLLDTAYEILAEPRTRKELSQQLKLQGYKLKLKEGGGWGDKRSVPFVEVGGTSFSVGFLIHLIGARDVICFGPSVGAESTYVRADRWLPSWIDTDFEKAEEEILKKYLRAFGPATLADFALWLGVYARDAKEMWSRLSRRIAEVEVDGVKAAVLESDLGELEKAKLDEHVVRLLPNFDTFLLGHKSHLNVVDERNRKLVYRGQGWISSVLLVDGQSLGVWTSLQRKGEFEVRVEPFTKLSASLKSQVKGEASDLANFLGFSSVKTTFAS
jgi:RNase P/RNase MRP subunit POP5